MDQVQAIPIAVVLTAALITTATDLWSFKIYNILTVPLLVSGVIYHSVVGGMPGFQGSLLGLFFGFGALLAFYVMGGMGAGDVKLMAAIGRSAWPAVDLPSVPRQLAGRRGLFVEFCWSWAEVWPRPGPTLQILWLRLVILSRHMGTGERVEVEVNRPDRRRRLVPFAAMVMIGTLALIVLNKLVVVP